MIYGYGNGPEGKRRPGMGGAAQQAAGMAPPNTFAGMQRAGYARPARPQARPRWPGQEQEQVPGMAPVPAPAPTRAPLPGSPEFIGAAPGMERPVLKAPTASLSGDTFAPPAGAPTKPTYSWETKALNYDPAKQARMSELGRSLSTRPDVGSEAHRRDMAEYQSLQKELEAIGPLQRSMAPQEYAAWAQKNARGTDGLFRNMNFDPEVKNWLNGLSPDERSQWVTQMVQAIPGAVKTDLNDGQGTYSNDGSDIPLSFAGQQALMQLQSVGGLDPFTFGNGTGTGDGSGSTPTTSAPATGGGSTPSAAQGGAGNMDLGGYLQGMLTGSPTGYDDAALKSEFARLAGGIDDEFAQRQEALNDEMAARGLFDSAGKGLMTGRLSDLNIGRRSAKVDLADRLSTKRAESLNQGRQSWFDRLNQFGQQAFDNDYRSAAFNFDVQNAQDKLLLALLGGG